MPLPQPYNTGLTEEQIAEVFRRALEDMTDTEIMNLLSGKVDKAEGYSLMSDAEHSTLAEVYGTTSADVPDTIKIHENDDLNSYETPGVFKCTSSSIAATLSNCPTNQSFRLEVVAILAYDRAYQICYPNQQTAVVYIRSRTSGGWNSWQTISDTSAMNSYVINTAIPENGDLNNYAGDVLGMENYRVFYTESNAITQTIANKPADWASGTFTLEVMRTGANQYMQRLTHQLYNGSAADIYIRTKVHSATVEAWRDWYKIALVPVASST